MGREVYVVTGPYTPTTPVGPQTVKPNEQASYYAKSDHPKQEQLWYLWDWSDGTQTSWEGTYPSGTLVEGSHTWNENGYYKVRVKSRDRYGVESEWWSDPLPVSIPKNKAINPFLLFLERLIERFPILEQILQPIYDKLA